MNTSKPRPTVQVFEVVSKNTIATPDGTVHYNIDHQMPRTLRASIPLDTGHKDEWLSFLDLFVYCTRSGFFKLGSVGSPGVIVPSQISFACTDNRDEHGRRQFITHQVTEAPESVLLGQVPIDRQ
jgi:hypothetical protein